MNKTVNLAIKRHDIDAPHFQAVYSKQEKDLNKQEKAFLTGRQLVLKELEEMLRGVPAGAKVLDIGCGTAHLSNWIREKGYEVYGLEPSDEMYNYAQMNFPDINIEKGISSQLPYKDCFFDFVVAFEVLRYLDAAENKKTYSEIYRVLKKDGTFFLTQVNRYSTDLYFFYYHIKDFYSNLLHKVHHYCNFTSSAREIQLAGDAGFSTVHITGVLNGSIRLAYKLNKRLGDFWLNLSEKNFSQRTENTRLANFKAHLLVTGKK
jgi:ubiquinone/menaquinone biosynthesis C-methylase UbiE